MRLTARFIGCDPRFLALGLLELNMTMNLILRDRSFFRSTSQTSRMPGRYQPVTSL
jgi:hypothetical protein